MIFLPWIGFFAVAGWMIYRGFDEKKKYLKNRTMQAEREQAKRENDFVLKGLRVVRDLPQEGQVYDLGLGGTPHNPHQGRQYQN